MIEKMYCNCYKIEQINPANVTRMRFSNVYKDVPYVRFESESEYFDAFFKVDTYGTPLYFDGKYLYLMVEYKNEVKNSLEHAFVCVDIEENDLVRDMLRI